MTDNISINHPQIKSLDNNVPNYNSLFQEVTDLDELNFEEYLSHKPCFKCRHDHTFKPSFNNLQTSIDHASELVALFFNGGSNNDE
jgi:hypothetical protein